MKKRELEMQVVVLTDALKKAKLNNDALEEITNGQAETINELRKKNSDLINRNTMLGNKLWDAEKVINSQSNEIERLRLEGIADMKAIDELKKEYQRLWNHCQLLEMRINSTHHEHNTY